MAGEQATKTGRTRRANLTLAQRLEPVEASIKFHEEQLAAAKQRRASIVEREEQKLRVAQEQLAQARALEQVEMPGVTHSERPVE